MSADKSESKNSLVSIFGNAFLVLVPLSLIVMLGYVGVGFIHGMKDEKAAEPVVAAATVPPAGTPATAAPAPAAPAAPNGAPAGGSNATGIDPTVMALGKTTFAMCAACHGPDGTGLKVGPALMAPSMVGSKVLLGDPENSLLVVLKGIAKEDMNFMGMMAPLGAALDDQKLAAVLTYVRNDWGNSAPAVTVEQAAAARKKYAAVDAPAGVKRAEIEKIVAAHK